MVTLDDVERTFSADMALVCDAEGPSGIAGVMGGQVSEVSAETTRVLMEAATWVGTRSEEHTSELQSRQYLVCRLLLEKKKMTQNSKDLAMSLRLPGPASP